jgi:hypothetical protein
MRVASRIVVQGHVDPNWGSASAARRRQGYFTAHRARLAVDVLADVPLIARMNAYEPRPICFHGLREVEGWRLKCYSIVYGPDPIDWLAFTPGLALADEALPRPAVTPGRPGVGFVIAHRGRTALYCVLAWWDNENELPVRVFVRALEDAAAWRPARGSESFCVWDLQVIAFEREAYVATLLAPRTDPGAATRAYLGAVLYREPAAAPRVGAAGGSVAR